MTAFVNKRGFMLALNVSVYGAVSTLLSGFLLFLPAIILIPMAAMAYCLFLFSISVQKIFLIGDKDASVFVALATTIFFVAQAITGALVEKLGLH